MALLAKVLREAIPFWSKRFDHSTSYWKRRYRYGGDSGRGSESEKAKYKARFIDDFCRTHGIHSVIELGCGDGQVASLMTVPRYIGLDISEDAARIAKKRCAKSDWRFSVFEPSDQEGLINTARELNGGALPELVLSMDVILHLVEDDVLETYLQNLTHLSTKYALIYAINEDKRGEAHVLHRRYTETFLRLNPEWILVREYPNPLFDGQKKIAHFILFEKQA